ncbi:hypothetical protein [Mucilaginibacter ginkgonis]|uniref:Phenylalanyl-tRNA synthetase subunit beta n=1 Tax=Mucilaginibacter ginkgonis TaxID=2682091 RepID=A0A6I4IMM8_9SPHI|nr:hypothetical protein [Mucilaginibacter ginkgonis]QQL50029.1 hypothetical protein GO620_000835 [Mucilaginibacter ginkgonis]
MSTTQQLAAITQKTERLIELCAALQQENDLLKAESDRLEAAVVDGKTRVVELEERLRVLKVAKSFSGGEEKSLDMKKKINEFVQEIDKCIVLLKK